MFILNLFLVFRTTAYYVFLTFLKHVYKLQFKNRDERIEKKSSKKSKINIFLV